VGAAIGEGLGELAHSKVKTTIEEQAFETIPYGGAALIIAYPRPSADVIDASVTRSLKKVVGEAEGKRVKALKQALAEAQANMQK